MNITPCTLQRIFRGGKRVPSFLGILFIFFLGLQVSASPKSLTYQGRILKSDGTPLEYNNVSFVFQITDPTGQCVIYQEQVNGINMTNSAGVFDVPIGNGTIQYPLSATSAVLDVFNNTSSFSCGSCSLVNGTYTCSNGSSNYAAVSGDIRKLHVAFYDGSGWKTITPDNTIRSVPFAGYALSAEKLGTNVAGDFLLKAGLPTCTAGTFLSYNGTALDCVPVAGASGGTVTTVTSANSYLTVINNTSAPALTVNVGTVANTVAAGNDPRLSDARTPTGAAGGVLNGSYPNPGLVDNSVTTSKINDAAVSTAKLFAISGINRLVATDATTGATLAPLTCASGQLLTWNLTNGWQCSNQSSLVVGSATTATTSTNFTGTLVGDVSGTQGATSVDKIKGVPLDFSVAPTNGQVLKFNGTNWAPATDSNAAGTITALTSDVSASGSGSVAATVNSVGGSTAANIHSAELLANAATSASSTRTIVMRDPSGNFSAGIITANLTGNVTGSASLNVLKAGDTMTGNLTFGSNKGNVFTDSGVNTVTVQAPTTVPTSYVLKLPTAQGSSNQVLTNDGLGNLSWTTPSTTASSYSGVLPIANGGTNSSTALNDNRIMVSSGNAIVEASALTNGQLLIGSTGAAPVAASLAAGSGITITPAAGSITIGTTGLQASSLADGKIWVGQTGTPTAVTPSGDATMTNAGVLKVTGIQGISVSATSPSAAGQVLRYDGTSNYAPAFLGLADIKSSITPFPGAFTNAGCTTSQSLYWQSSTDTFECQSVAIGDSQITYASKTANTFLAAPTGAAGAPTFRGIASADLPTTGANGAYVNGGNSFGAAATLGTNDAFTFGIKTNNATRMTFDTAGKVGIGISVPAYNLDLSANNGLTADAWKDVARFGEYNTGHGLTMGYIVNSGGTDLAGAYLNALGTGVNQYLGTTNHGQAISIQDSTGSVGIGTTSPSGALNIVGTTSDNTSSTLKLQKASGATILYARNDGFVGFNTTSPSAVIDARDAAQPFSANDPTIAIYSNSAQGAGVGGTIGVGGADGVSSNRTFGMIGGFKENSTSGNYAGYLAFATRPNAGNSAERMRIDSAGNVGIGTANPTQKFHVHQSVNNVYGAKIANDGGDGQGLLIAAGAIPGFNSNQTILSVKSFDLSYPYFEVKGGGNVGIGTTAPGRKLTVYDANTSVIQVDKGTSAAGKYALITYSTAGANKFYVGIDGDIGGATDKYTIYDYSASTAALTVTGGKVGINMTTPGANLEVAGTADLQNLNHLGGSTSNVFTNYTVGGTVIGSVTDNGSWTGVAYNTTSDRRLKENIKETSSGLQDLLKIKVYDYSFIKDPDHNKVTGFIAQEVFQVFPDAVHTNGDDGIQPLEKKQSPWGVDYGRITPLIVKALKDFYHQWINDSDAIHRDIANVKAQANTKADMSDVVQLKADNEAKDEKIKKLEQENAAIKARLDKIEKALNSN